MTFVRQALAVLAGLVLAAGMVVLGIWQYDVYQAEGARAAAERAAGAPLLLHDVARAGTAVTDGFGRSVSVTGRYDPDLQQGLAVGGQPGRFRVLTGLRQADGSVVAVVRGVSGPALPLPPAGLVTQVGVLLPSEDSGDDGSAVRLPVLAQTWPGPLVGGFVTLAAADAEAQGLQPAPLQLPEAPGRLRNGAYALQWWLFAGFALFMAARIARDLGRQEDLAGLDAVEMENGVASDPT